MKTPGGRRWVYRAIILMVLMVPLVFLARGPFPSGEAAHIPVSASGSPVRVVVLGDSVPAGLNCDCTPFGEQVAQRLGQLQHRPFETKNLAVSGSLTDELIQQLAIDDTKQAIATADLVIIQSGANDFDEAELTDQKCAGSDECFASQLALTKQHLNDIVSSVKALLTIPTARVEVLGYWNLFMDGDSARGEGDAYAAASERLTRAFNRMVAEVARVNRVVVPDVFAAFKGIDGGTNPTRLLAPDGDHPNASGHQVLADVTFAALGPQARTL